MKYIRIITITALSIFFIVVFIPNFTLPYMYNDLSSEATIMNKNNTGLTLTDRYGNVFFTFYQVKNKNFVPLSNIPLYTQQAIIASEDREFYTHSGFSAKGIIRSLITNTINRKIQSGGSTITQQLVKNVLLSNEKSFMRKYQEIFIAFDIEKKYNKDKILEMYMNSVYFGNGAFGIENAAKTYFGKDAKDLSLGESALLVGILPSPSSFSAIKKDKEKITQTQQRVLNAMLEMNFITKNQMDNVKKEDLVFSESKDNINIKAPHFALLVRDELIGKYGEEEIARSGYKVKTTLDMNYQDYSEKAVKDQVYNLAADSVTNGSVVVLDPKTGEILAMVGSYDWNNNSFGKVNMAVSPRQPGSSFKPIVYATGFEKSIITPTTILHDAPTIFTGGYSPKDYDGKFRGPVTVRRALSNSLNVPAVELMTKVGVENAILMAHRLGISTLDNPSDYGLSLVLGAGEVTLLDMTDVYSVFANNGYRNKPVDILQIDDKFSKTIYAYKPNPEMVLKSEYTFLISSILSDNNTRKEEFGSLLDVSRPAAVKTGTTENYKDAWTIGYTPDIVIGAWVGNNDGTVMDNVAGSLGAAPIWKQLIEKFSQGKPIKYFEPPPGIVTVQVCGFNSSNNKDIKQTVYNYTEFYVKGTEPAQSCIISDLKNNNTAIENKINIPLIRPKDILQKFRNPKRKSAAN